MPDKARETVVINASVQVCFDTLTDFERYPQWASDLKQAVVVERDDQGRAAIVEFRAAAMGRSTTYRLRYDYEGAPHQLSWFLDSGDLQRELDGAYHLRAIDDPSHDGESTEVVYELSVDLILPIPGFVKRRAETRILKTALTDLKQLVESSASAS
jgi:ribosome-associated toxin RatA of RatAB toxin-antitoxin module